MPYSAWHEPETQDGRRQAAGEKREAKRAEELIADSFRGVKRETEGEGPGAV